MWEYHTDLIWKSSLLLFLSAILYFAVMFHMIFVPDHRPGRNTMPFLWVPVFKSLYKLKFESAALFNVYILNYLIGLSKISGSPKLVGCKVLKYELIFIFKADAAEAVLGNSKFNQKGYEYKVFEPLLNEGLLRSEGEKWQTRRKLLTPTFHFKILLDFMPVLQEKSMNLVSKLNMLIDKPWVDVDNIMHTCSLDVILQTAMGVRFDAKDEEITKCIDAVKKGISYSVAQMFRAWVYLDVIYRMSSLERKTVKNFKIIQDFVKKVLQEKKKNMILSRNKSTTNGVETNGFIKKKKNVAFLDLLLDLHEEDSSFTEEDILEETITFFIAGFDTTGSALSYSLYFIGLHKDIQEKIHKELDTIFKESDRDITREDLKEMKYLDCTIKESIRLYPPVPYFSRCATEDFEIYGSKIKKGSSMIISPHLVHRDPEIFPDPERFIPERFFPENCIGRHPFAYLPFSAGQRNCVGQKFGLMEVKTVLANVLRKFSVTSLDERDKILGIASIGKRCSEPLRMKFYHRKKQC